MEAALHGAAENRGIVLDQDRLALLTQAAVTAQNYPDEPIPDMPGYIFADPANYIYAKAADFHTDYGTTAAYLDFCPRVDPTDEYGFVSAQPKHAALFGSMAIKGLQHYALLVDAGYIEMPNILYGETYGTMAIVAERLGMYSDIARSDRADPHAAHKLMRMSGRMGIYGGFDQVSARIFSADTIRLQQAFATRVAGQRAAH
jgi:hypothetical protein